MALTHFLSFKYVSFCLFMMYKSIFMHEDCHRDFCLPLKFRQDGYYTTNKKEYSYGDRISYSCKYLNGYVFGDSSLICGEDGYWHGEEPYCAYQETIVEVKHDHKSNENLFDKNNASCVTSGNPRSWTIVTERFASGLTVIEIIIQGRGNSFCSIENSGMKIKNCKNAEIKELFRNGNYLYCSYIFECNVRSETRTFHINQENAWYDRNLCEIYIFRKPRNICPLEVKICNGGANDTSKDTDNINDPRMLIYCNEGYKLEGKRVLRCEDGALIGINETKCTRVTCNSTPPAIVNGEWFYWSHSKIYYYGNRLVVSCNDGYKFSSGVNFTQCQEDGSWSTADAVCTGEEVTLRLLIPIAVGMVILTVVTIIIITACICCRRKSEMPKDKVDEEIYSEPSYCTSERSTKNQTLPPLPPPNPNPFYADPVDAYSIDDDANYYEPYISRNDDKVMVSHNKSKINPSYSFGETSTKNKSKTSDGNASSIQLNVANTLYGTN